MRRIITWSTRDWHPWIVIAGASLFVPRRTAEAEASGPALLIRRLRAALCVVAQASFTVVLHAALVTKW